MMAQKVNLSDAIEKATTEKRIGRSFVFTLCEGHTYASGEPMDFVDTLLGNWNASRATQRLRHVHGDSTITIVHTTVYKQYCDMSAIDFWLNARATSDPQQVQEYFITD